MRTPADILSLLKNMEIMSSKVSHFQESEEK